VDRSFAGKTAAGSNGSTSAGQPTMLAVSNASLSGRSLLEWRVHVGQQPSTCADWTSGLGHFRSLAHQENRLANDRFRLGLFDTCPRAATTVCVTPV
jgi:hypothetical protein